MQPTFSSLKSILTSQVNQLLSIFSADVFGTAQTLPGGEGVVLTVRHESNVLHAVRDIGMEAERPWWYRCFRAAMVLLT